jgi:hypothetical protein
VTIAARAGISKLRVRSFVGQQLLGTKPRMQSKGQIGGTHRGLTVADAKTTEAQDPCSTVAVLRLVLAMLRWGLIWHAAPVTLGDWFSWAAELHG